MNVGDGETPSLLTRRFSRRGPDRPPLLLTSVARVQACRRRRDAVATHAALFAPRTGQDRRRYSRQSREFRLVGDGGDAAVLTRRFSRRAPDRSAVATPVSRTSSGLSATARRRRFRLTLFCLDNQQAFWRDDEPAADAVVGSAASEQSVFRIGNQRIAWEIMRVVDSLRLCGESELCVIIARDI